MYSASQPTKPIPASRAPALIRLILGKVKAGFPSPAEDLGEERLDLAGYLGSDKEDAFFMFASGHSMVTFGIFDGDLLLIRKRKRPRDGHIVVADVDGEFLVELRPKQSVRTTRLAGGEASADAARHALDEGIAFYQAAAQRFSSRRFEPPPPRKDR